MSEWKQKRLCQQKYDSTAFIYDTRYSEEQNLKAEAFLNRLEIEAALSILDLGCGTGLFLKKMSRGARRVVGVDLSKGMLREIKLSVRRLENIHLIQSDADYIPLRPRLFNIVVALTLLQNMPNPIHTIEEAKRVAKPDALIIVTGLKKRFSNQSFTGLLRQAKLKPEFVKGKSEIKCRVALCRRY